MIPVKHVEMRRAFTLATTFAVCGIALGAWWWLRLPIVEPMVRGSAFSSFAVPDHLDASAFTQRLTAVGFVELNDADFGSLLPQKYHGSAIAPGNPPSDLKSMQAFQHKGNTDSMTRIIGFDAQNRKVHYFRSQVYARENGEGRMVDDGPDTIEEELRK